MSHILDAYGERLPEVYQKICEPALGVDGLLGEALRYHLLPLHKSKGFRPALCLALGGSCESAVTVQLSHEATLVFDDILDRGTVRRGQRCVHCKYGRTIAGAVGLWLMAKAQAIVAGCPSDVLALSWCSRAIAEAEALQWQLRTRGRPVPLEHWKQIAFGDTGALLRLAVRLANADYLTSAEIDALTYLYHGLDDVHDILDAGPLAGGKTADVRDRIPTLLTCFTDAVSYEGLREAVPMALTYLRSLFPEQLEDTRLEPFFNDLRVWFDDAWNKT